MAYPHDNFYIFPRLRSLTPAFKFSSIVSTILDCAVHGHTKAKRQIERIIGQWINGEQSGYCFGFEGPPGVGKTSLARKGLAKCLKNDDSMTKTVFFCLLRRG